MRILNRVVMRTISGTQYEGDQRHVEIAMREFSLNEEPRKVGVPIAKEEDSRGSENKFDKCSARQYRESLRE